MKTKLTQPFVCIWLCGFGGVKDLNNMLRYTDDLIDAMIEIIVTKRWLQTMLNVLEYQQMLVQGIWVKDHALLQLPHFTEKEVGHVLKGKGSIKTLTQYLAVRDLSLSLSLSHLPID